MELLNLANNQTIVYTETEKVFFSYEQKVATYSIEKRTLVLYGNTWDASATTRKYFAKFINHYTQFTYVDKKNFTRDIQEDRHITVI